MTPRGGADGDDAHPTDGAWRPLDAFVLNGADPASSCPAGFTGFTVRWTTILKQPDAWDPFYDELLELEAPLRIDLDDASPAKRHRDFTDALSAGPDIVCFDGAKTPWTSDSFDRIDGEAAEDEVALVLSARPRHLSNADQHQRENQRENQRDSQTAEHQRLLDFLHGSQSVTALRMEAYDEDLAEILGHPRGFGLFSPGFEFASAFRRGAGALEGDFGLLGPAAASEALELARCDLPAALMLERKLQRFTEGAFERATRRLGPPERQRALADTFAYFEEGRGAPPGSIASEDWSMLLAAIDKLELFPT